MNLKRVRELFVRWSGRSDLANDDGSDRGADVFIQQGADWLDEVVENPKSVSRYLVEVAVGDHFANVPRLQRVESIWIMGVINGITGRQKLDEKDLNWMRDRFSGVWSDLDKGVPKYYSYNVIGLQGNQWEKDLDGLSDVTDIYDVEDHFDDTGILWMPPANVVFTLTVFGDFYQRILDSDSAINYWTSFKPLVLAKAACLMQESSLRNFQGESDWEKSLARDLRGIDIVTAGQAIGESNEMRG